MIVKAVSSRLPDVQGCHCWRTRSWSTASVAAAEPAPSTACTSSAVSQQPRLVTYQIAKSRSLEELSVICHEQQQLNPIHISAVFSACVRHTRRRGSTVADPQSHNLLPQLCLQQHEQQAYAASTADHLQVQAMVSQALGCFQEQQHLFQGREIANVLWCLATLQVSPPPGVLQRLVARFEDVAHASTCQSHSMVLYALTVLGYRPDAAVLDQLLHSMVKAGRRAASRGRGGHQMQLSTQQPGYVQRKEQPQLRQGSTQAFANAIWALNQLQQPAVARVWLLPLLCLLYDSVAATVTGGIQQQQQQQQQEELPGAAAFVEPASASGQLCSQARLVRTVATSLWAGVYMLKSKQCSDTAAAAQGTGLSEASAGVPSYPPRLVPRVQHLVSRLLECSSGCLCSASLYEITTLLWACNRLQLRPSSNWVQAMFAATGQQLSSCSVRECVSLLRGVAHLRLSPPRSWLACLFTATRRHFHSMTGEQLASLVWSCGTLRVRPPVDWMSAVTTAFARQLASSSSSSSSPPTSAVVSMLVAGASKIGYQPPGPVALRITQAVQASAAEYGPRQASQLLLGCNRLQWNLQRQLLSVLLQSLIQQVDRLASTDVTMAVRALAHARAAAIRSLQAVLEQQQQQQRSWHGAQPAAPVQAAAAGLRSPHLHLSQLQHPGRVQLATYTQPLQRLQLLQQRQQQLQEQLRYAESAQGQQAQLLFNRAEQLLAEMPAAELCQCLYSAVYLGPKLSWQWSHALNHVLPEHMQQLSPGDLCLLLWSIARLHDQLQVKRLLHKQLLVHSQKLMLAGKFTPRDLSMFMWHYKSAFRSSRQGLPRAWVAVFSRAARSQLRYFSVKQLGVMLRACVLLEVMLEPQLLEHAGLMLELWSAKLERSERAMVVASLLQLQQLNMRASSAPRVQSNAVRFWPAEPQQQQQQQQQQQRVIWVQGSRTRYYTHSWEGQGGGLVTAGDLQVAEQQQQQQQWQQPSGVLTLLR